MPQTHYIGLDMDYGRFFGWLLLNVAVPLLAPIAFFPLLNAGKGYSGRVRELIMRSVREGQLFWTVIAMCAAASYEAAVHMGELEGDEIAGGTSIAWAAIAWHVAIIISSAVLIVLNTMDAADADVQAAEGVDQAPQIMVVSIWMSIATAVSFTATHLWAS
ncbi:MAG: hypothetical protein WCC39_14290 [Telluria sp.]